MKFTLLMTPIAAQRSRFVKWTQGFFRDCDAFVRKSAGQAGNSCECLFILRGNTHVDDFDEFMEDVPPSPTQGVY
ncbi:hypothetical protein NC652_004917 [Populus alba x Populus x berolinensis]|nr:hypothetical protein NC652_004917 [Populus alba x Populus x berolinensis]